MARPDRRRKTHPRSGSLAGRSRRHVGHAEVVSALEHALPNRHAGYRDPGVQASRNDVPWLFLFEVGAAGMLVAWVRRRLLRQR